MTMMSGNNRHETFLIVRCSSVGTAVVLLAAMVRLSPAGLAATPSRAGNSPVNQGSLPYGGSAHQTGALVIEPPAGDQVLHCLGVIACAQGVLLVEPMGRLDLRHVDLHSETGPIGNSNHAARDLQRLLGQALSVLPDPVRVDR